MSGLTPHTYAPQKPPLKPMHAQVHTASPQSGLVYQPHPTCDKVLCLSIGVPVVPAQPSPFTVNPAGSADTAGITIPVPSTPCGAPMQRALQCCPRSLILPCAVLVAPALTLAPVWLSPFLTLQCPSWPPWERVVTSHGCTSNPGLAYGFETPSKMQFLSPQTRSARTVSLSLQLNSLPIAAGFLPALLLGDGISSASVNTGLAHLMTWD